MVLTVALLPALFPGAGDTDAPTMVRAAASGPAVAAAAPSDELPTTTTAPAPAPTTSVAPTTTTTAPPATTTTTTTVAKPRPTTAVPRPTTTTTTTAPSSAPAADADAAGSESGKASWYDHQSGVCAHKTLPFGTTVTVTHTGNGRRTTCTVGDRGPFIEGWIIDLHPDQFDDLAPTSTGVIPVRITWE